MAVIQKALQYVDTPSAVLVLLILGVCALGVGYASAERRRSQRTEKA